MFFLLATKMLHVLFYRAKHISLSVDRIEDTNRVI